VPVIQLRTSSSAAFSVVNGLLFKGLNSSAQPDVGRIAISSLDDPTPTRRWPSSSDSPPRSVARPKSPPRTLERGVAVERSDRIRLGSVCHAELLLDGQCEGARRCVARRAERRRRAHRGHRERFWREKLMSASLAGLTLRVLVVRGACSAASGRRTSGKHHPCSQSASARIRGAVVDRRHASRSPCRCAAARPALANTGVRDRRRSQARSRA
jgi:hypothetical protein